jgi:hypothetical protein
MGCVGNKEIVVGLRQFHHVWLVLTWAEGVSNDADHYLNGISPVMVDQNSAQDVHGFLGGGTADSRVN